MNGQWLGRYDGSNSGTLIIDLDDCGTHYEGYAYAYDHNINLPSTYAPITTPDKSNTVNLTVHFSPLNPSSGNPLTPAELQKFYPGTVFGTEAKVTLEHENSLLKIEWKTDIGTWGKCVLPKSKASEPSYYSPLDNVKNWKQFKDFVFDLEFRKYIFRGQSKPHRLRTCFHRSGRADLQTFLDVDRIILYRHLTQRTRNIFNLNDPDQNGAFLGLIQHHGYPTPLLDWTYSPFIGAFFAYRDIKNTEAKMDSENKMVRIFVFDQLEWRAKYAQSHRLTGSPHFSLMEFMAIENERLLPQQSISTVTNVDDIESFIMSHESVNQKFLKVIDLPISERSKVMSDLSTMGITAGSLFPGLDGTCEEIKERFFDF
ncbi:MAG: FRG domain-containing protein [Bdellovibrionota bacterium]